jgi:Tfp pilus assembly protein PilW
LDIDATRVSPDARGVFLHDILVGCALSGFVLAATYTVLEQGLRAYTVGAARVEGQQAARAALARMSFEIRNAGRGARWTASAIAVAERSRLVLASDLDDDGTTSDRGELITWQLVGSVLRRNAGAGAQPVASGVRDLELRYFDAAGRSTTDPLAVRVVEVVLVTAPAGPESGLARGVATTMTTRARLRNR